LPAPAMGFAALYPSCDSENLMVEYDE
jgi:hypothetical protein